MFLTTRRKFKTHSLMRTAMCSELLARIVLSSSICQVVLLLLSPILFCQCGHLSFCSLRVVSLPRQMRPHVDPTPAPPSRVPWAHPLHLAQLGLVSSLFHPLCLGDRVFVCTHPCFSRQGSLNDRSDSFSTFVVVWFDRSSIRCQCG